MQEQCKFVQLTFAKHTECHYTIAKKYLTILLDLKNRQSWYFKVKLLIKLFILDRVKNVYLCCYKAEGFMWMGGGAIVWPGRWWAQKKACCQDTSHMPLSLTSLSTWVKLCKSLVILQQNHNPEGLLLRFCLVWAFVLYWVSVSPTPTSS